MEADVFKETAPDAARGNVEVILSSARLAVETRNGSQQRRQAERRRIREGFLVDHRNRKRRLHDRLFDGGTGDHDLIKFRRGTDSSRRRRRRLRQRVLSIQCA